MSSIESQSNIFEPKSGGRVQKEMCDPGTAAVVLVVCAGIGTAVDKFIGGRERDRDEALAELKSERRAQKKQ